MHAAKGILTTPRGHDLPRRGGRAGLGQALRRGLRRPHRSTTAPTVSRDGRRRRCARATWISLNGTTGRGDPRGRGATDAAGERGLRDLHGRGSTRHARSACAPTPTRPRDAAVARELRRRGHRPLPHRAHVLRGRPHPRVREMILATTSGARARRSRSSCPCSARTSPGSSRDGGLPVTIRLLDPPLHEFLPARARAAGSQVAQGLGVTPRACARVRALHESNPMLGPPRLPPRHHHPEITRCRRGRSSRRRARRRRPRARRCCPR
jgi:pyruvate,orthophosphate dikinase